VTNPNVIVAVIQLLIEIVKLLRNYDSEEKLKVKVQSMNDALKTARKTGDTSALEDMLRRAASSKSK
jgi:Ca2+-binding EF-hand superfamily protein